MDDSLFDNLVRSLGSASRRTMVRRLTSAALGGTLMPALGEVAAATPDGQRRLKKCKKLKGKAKKKCIRRADEPHDVEPTPIVPDPPPPLCGGIQCIDEGIASCGTNGLCSHDGQCLKYSAGATCRSASCKNGIETLAAECDGNGNCPLVQRNCGPAGCGPTACKLANGEPCRVGGDCVSTHCVRGICCDHACVGEHAGTPGNCFLGACTLTCDAGWDNCDGAIANGCETQVGIDSQCTCVNSCDSTAFCDGTQCVPRRANGEPCTRDGQCQSNFCIEGTC